MIQQFIRDLKAKRNLDTYVAILAAVTVSVLSFTKLLQPGIVAGLTTALLGVVALNTLITRDAIATAVANHSDRFLVDFPPDLLTRRNSCKDVLIIGVTLSRTIDSSYGAFARSLREGGHVRVLLTDPDSSYAALDARGHISRPSADEVQQVIRQSISRLRKLAVEVPVGNLEVRLCKAAIKFGVNYLDPEKPSAYLCVQLYTYRLDGESRPIFVLTSADGRWFKEFTDQCEQLWVDSRPLDLP
jgi:hypothetical protein